MAMVLAVPLRPGSRWTPSWKRPLGNRCADVGYAAADVARAGAAQVLRVSGGADIPSDGQPHTVGLGDADLPVTLEYVSRSPVVASGAHLRATATNIVGRFLPSGRAGQLHGWKRGRSMSGETHASRAWRRARR